MSRRMTLLAAVVAAVVSSTGPVESISAAAPEGEGWAQIFNGKDLEGWEQRNGTATYKVEDGCVLGTTSVGSPNSFMCTKKKYDNFELVFEVKVDNDLNSGVQFRSATKEDKPSNQVHGPQCEIATNGSAACVYGEGLPTGWLSGPEKLSETQKTAFKNGEWNKYKIVANGKKIQTWLNGVAIVDFEDEKSGLSSGFIGLQVHGIGKDQGPFQVRWREIYIKELK